MKNRLRNGQAVRSLWRVWAFSMGAPILVIVLGLWISLAWLPVLAFLLEFILFLRIRINRNAELPTCYLMPFVMSRILFWSGLIMLIIDQLNVHGYSERWFELVNPNLPYIPILVLAPVTAVIAGWAVWRKHNLRFCEDCRMRFGTPAERGFLGKMFSQEGRYQVEFTMTLGIILTVVEYLYYFLAYINVNINTSDKFFFVWLPTIFYGVSLVTMALKYISLWSYYDQEITGNNVRRPDTTQLRYLIFDNEKLYLVEPDNVLSPLSRGLDTPATITLNRREDVPLYEARQYFQQLEVGSDFELRLMYKSIDAGGDSNVFHYIVTLTDPNSIADSRLRGNWYTLPELERLLNSNSLSSMLAAEIHRLYTITMAWKTYDRSGRRLYKIKNYRPTFRLRNIQNWDVDFNDPHWLRVAVNNQDKPFYQVKRFWRRYVNGIQE